jgi:hypothetical protein
MQNERYTKDAIEIVRTLGEDAVRLLLYHLDNSQEIIEVRALTGDDAMERKWRKYGRLIYILGELHADALTAKLRIVFRSVKDIHLLYHIVIALYTLDGDEATKLLCDGYFKTHPDPLVRTFSTLAGLRITPNDEQLLQDSMALISALTDNIKNQGEMEFALRAHSAEALGLLGFQEAVVPLAGLLKNEKRIEPQTSAIKALGYIATKQSRDDINGEVVDALIDSLETGNVYNNRWGKKLIKELLLLFGTKENLKKLRNAVARISRSTEDEITKQSRRDILDEVISASQTRD